MVDTAILPPSLLRHRRFTTRAHPHLFEETRGGAGRKTIDLQPRQVAGVFHWYNRGRTLGFGLSAAVDALAVATDEGEMRILVMESINALPDRVLLVQEARRRAH